MKNPNRKVVQLPRQTKYFNFKNIFRQQIYVVCKNRLKYHRTWNIHFGCLIDFIHTDVTIILCFMSNTAFISIWWRLHSISCSSSTHSPQRVNVYWCKDRATHDATHFRRGFSWCIDNSFQIAYLQYAWAALSFFSSPCMKAFQFECRIRWQTTCDV